MAWKRNKERKRSVLPECISCGFTFGLQILIILSLKWITFLRNRFLNVCRAVSTETRIGYMWSDLLKCGCAQAQGLWVLGLHELGKQNPRWLVRLSAIGGISRWFTLGSLGLDAAYNLPHASLESLYQLFRTCLQSEQYLLPWRTWWLAFLLTSAPAHLRVLESAEGNRPARLPHCTSLYSSVFWPISFSLLSSSLPMMQLFA